MTIYNSKIAQYITVIAVTIATIMTIACISTIYAKAEFLPPLNIIVIDDETGEEIDIADIIGTQPNEPPLHIVMPEQIDPYEILEPLELEITLEDLEGFENIQEALETIVKQNSGIIILLCVIVGTLIGLGFLTLWSPDRD
jgi:hypothetical protein